MNPLESGDFGGGFFEGSLGFGGERGDNRDLMAKAGLRGGKANHNRGRTAAIGVNGGENMDNSAASSPGMDLISSGMIAAWNAHLPGINVSH